MLCRTEVPKAAVFYFGASPILENLLITNNTAVRGGGVLEGSNDFEKFKNILESRSPLDAGGGLWLEGNTSPEIYHSIQNVLIHHNSALAMAEELNYLIITQNLLIVR